MLENMFSVGTTVLLTRKHPPTCTHANTVGIFWTSAQMDAWVDLLATFFRAKPCAAITENKHSLLITYTCTRTCTQAHMHTHMHTRTHTVACDAPNVARETKSPDL